MLGRLGISTSGAATIRLDYQSESLVNAEEIKDGNGMRGTLSHNVDRTRPSLQRIAGPIKLIPNAAELAAVLPWITGAAGTGSGAVSYLLSNSCITKDVQIDRSGGSGLTAKVFSYASVGVDTATFTCAQGDALNLDLGCVAKTETPGDTFPTLSIDFANGPWMLADLVMSIAGTTIAGKDLEISINNNIDKERYFNSNTLTDIIKQDRQIMVKVSLPFGDHAALYAAGSAGVAVVATFTNGGAILVFTMPKVVYPRRSPSIQARAETILPIEGQAYKQGVTAGTTDELSMTLNIGP